MYKISAILIFSINHADNYMNMGFSFLTTNKASIFKNFIFLLLFTPEIRECVDDDTKDEVQNDDDDNEEEQKIVDDTGNKQVLLQTKNI